MILSMYVNDVAFLSVPLKNLESAPAKKKVREIPERRIQFLLMISWTLLMNSPQKFKSRHNGRMLT